MCNKVGLPPGKTYELELEPVTPKEVPVLHVEEHVKGNQHAVIVSLVGSLSTLDERRQIALELINAGQDLHERHRNHLVYNENTPRLVVRQGRHQ